MNLNPKYKPLFTSKSRYFIITGGRGSSKSFSVNTWLNYLTFEKGRKVLFTRYTMTSAEISIIPEFIEKGDLIGASKHYQVNKREVVNTSFGTEVIFRGIKTSSGVQSANLKSIQGITDWILDEAEELQDEKIFDDIDLSVRLKGIQNRVILIMNPATREHWIYKRFFEDMGVNDGFNGTKGDVTYIHTTYKDNAANLSKSFLSGVERMRTQRPEKYKHQILGGWLKKAEGVIFNNWKLGDFDNSLPVIFGEDYGFSNDPSTLVKVAVDSKKKIIYLHECVYRQHLTTSQLIDLNKRYAGNNLIIGDSAEPRLIEEMRRAGVNIQPSQKGADSIRIGISRMLDFEMVVTSGSTNLIKELNNYAWSDKKSGVAIDKHNHLLDAVRYSLEKLIGNPSKKIYSKVY
jgi:phage terminase large subunit